ncbi:MAG: SusC/RagA family TonB-linked outer membrane protein, partial [Ginsengibacter sp.]
QIFSQMSLKQKIPFVPGLSFKGTFAYDPTFSFHKVWNPPIRQSVLDRSQTPPKIVPGIFGQTRASLDQNDSRMERYTFQAGVDFERSFGFNNIKFTGVLETIQDHASSMGAFRRNFNLLMDELSLGSSSNADMRTSGISSNARQVGLVYRVNYDYNNKYMFEASGRYDGSYYFSKNKRFGFFPAFSLGWNIAKENFIKDNLSWVNVLKIRSSYGEVGALAGAPFQYLSTFNIVGPGYRIGGEGVQIANENSEANPVITWERSKKTDVGFDGSFFNYQFDFGFDYFFEKRSNMLVQPLVTVPREYGIGLGQENAGIMQNQGIEVTAAFHHRFNQELSINLTGNFTYAHNKVLQIFETSATYNNLNRRLTGRPLGEQFGYKFIEYFLPKDFDQNGNLKSGIATQPWGKVFPGDMRYQDTNGDGKIDINDQVPIGEPINPQIVYGFSPSINYKGFDVNLLFQGAAKVNYYIRSEAIWPFWNSMAAFKDNFDYWRPDNLNAAFPRITLAPTTNNTQTSSHWMQNVSYLRLKNIMVSYDFMRLMKSNMADNIKSLKLFVSGQNMVTWTKIKNLDPEMINTRGDSYPQQKVLSVGVNVGF